MPHNMSENIPDLTIEPTVPETGLVVLEQNSGGNIDRIALHPVHVRHLAELLGFLARCPGSSRLQEPLENNQRKSNAKG